MKIMLKGTTPDGTKIQIEDWSEDYPTLYKKSSTIGFYPMCKTNIYREDKPYLPAYPERNKTFRASLNFDNETETKEAFLLMCGGSKNFLSYMDKYDSNVISKDNFLLAIV
jgi:hypothetical protein